jgi:hypothetical protein
MKQKLKPLQNTMPEELRNEVSTLYRLGIESYEVEYILSLRNKRH